MSYEKTFTGLERAIADLYYWQYRPAERDSFYSTLLTLWGKADNANIRKLEVAFPDHARAIEMWHQSGNNGDDLFTQYGLLKK